MEHVQEGEGAKHGPIVNLTRQELKSLVEKQTRLSLSFRFSSEGHASEEAFDSNGCPWMIDLSTPGRIHV